MKYIKNLIVLLSATLLASCHKNDSPVGVYLLPSSDVLGANYAEVMASVSYTMFDDSVYTKNISNSNLLGSVNDPVFGRSDASIYSSFEPNGDVDSSSLGTHPVLDSIVLSLVYAHGVSNLGDTNQFIGLDVYPLTEKLYNDSNYYSHRALKYDNNYNLVDGGQSKIFAPRINTSIKENKDDQLYALPQIRVRLRKEFGEMLFNYGYLNSLSNFQNAFKGLFISANRSVLPQPAYGSIFYIDMNSSAILMYYHNDAGVQVPQKLRCGPNSSRYGYFEHDHQFVADPKLSKQLYPTSVGDTTTNQNIYLQGNAGLKAKIEFPSLSTWADSNVVINKASLEFMFDMSQQDYLNTTTNPYPTRLYLEGQDPVTKKPTTLIENVYAFGGSYDGTNNNYAFQIPHTIANIVNRKTTNTTFYLSVFESALYPQRVVLGSWNNTTYPIKIKLWYTRLNFPKK
ncbi:MAG: DUF4270 family protein [Bacteroidia bacterium]